MDCLGGERGAGISTEPTQGFGFFFSPPTSILKENLKEFIISPQVFQSVLVH